MENNALTAGKQENLDTFLGLCAASSPAARYVRTLSSEAGRRTQMAAIVSIAEIVAPTAIPVSTGRGMATNQKSRFSAACALPWGLLKPERCGEIRAALIERGYAPSTANRLLAAMKGVLKSAWLGGDMDAESLARCNSSLSIIRGCRLPKGRHIHSSEMRALFSVVSNDDSVKAKRDAAVLALLALGLRRAEVANLTLSNYDRSSGRLVVIGKGQKERVLFVANGTALALNDWLHLRGWEEGPLLLAIGKNKKIRRQGLSPTAIHKIYIARSREAGIEATSSHDMRRTFIGNALADGMDLVTVSKVTGHSSPTTTARYDRRPEDAMRESMKKIVQVPYKGGAGS